MWIHMQKQHAGKYRDDSTFTFEIIRIARGPTEGQIFEAITVSKETKLGVEDTLL